MNKYCESSVGWDRENNTIRRCGARTELAYEGVPLCDIHIQYSTRPLSEWYLIPDAESDIKKP